VIEQEVEVVEMQHRDDRRKTPTEDQKVRDQLQISCKTKTRCSNYLWEPECEDGRGAIEFNVLRISHEYQRNSLA
jgi:hypothetical protein